MKFFGYPEKVRGAERERERETEKGKRNDDHWLPALALKHPTPYEFPALISIVVEKNTKQSNIFRRSKIFFVLATQQSELCKHCNLGIQVDAQRYATATLFYI